MADCLGIDEDKGNPVARVAVVSGASSGIGAATAAALAARGYRVALLARSRAALDGVAYGLPVADGGPHLVLPCDVGVAADVDAALAVVGGELGAPEVVVTAAGVCVPATLSETTEEIWESTISVNVTGTFNVVRAAVAGMDPNGGSIVMIGSEQSVLGVPNYSAYATSKAALLGLTRALAAELAPAIRVNLLCPGPVDTPMLEAEFALAADPRAARAAEERRVPLARIATADETAAAAVWLAVDAVYATGSALHLDGGTTGAFMAGR